MCSLKGYLVEKQQHKVSLDLEETMAELHLPVSQMAVEDQEVLLEVSSYPRTDISTQKYNFKQGMVILRLV